MSGHTPLWAWSLAVFGCVLLMAALLQTRTFRSGWPIAMLPLALCVMWPVAYGMAHAWDPVDAYHINTGPCPGVVAYKEIKATSRQSVQNITAAFILNGWQNITVQERGTDGFWSSTYSVVAARCNLEAGQ